MPVLLPRHALSTHRESSLLDLIQWSAMTVTLVASWLVAAKSEGERNYGFLLFLLSNALWIGLGVHTSAFALVNVQLGLAAMNIRGAYKNRRQVGAWIQTLVGEQHVGRRRTGS